MNPTTVVTADQLTTVTGILTQVFQGVIDFLYSVITVLVDFFTQPNVLGALVVIAIIYGAYKMLRRKRAHY